ncbi:MAG: enoyl-CoA hydratase, partial [Desulfobacterales bacterium]|nr:enoyl-CoA hydratase [Desulfobacterales bacterium]
MDENVLLVEEEAGIATLTLNRPEVMNSLNFPLLHALRNQIELFRIDRDIRVVIITGGGEKAFCAGADLKERATLEPDQVKDYIYT